MELNSQIIGIAVVIFALLIFNFFAKRAVKKFTILKKIEPHRKKVILNLTYFLSYTIATISIIGILNVELKQLLLFMSSILAILGVAFF